MIWTKPPMEAWGIIGLGTDQANGRSGDAPGSWRKKEVIHQTLPVEAGHKAWELAAGEQSKAPGSWAKICMRKSSCPRQKGISCLKPSMLAGSGDGQLVVSAQGVELCRKAPQGPPASTAWPFPPSWTSLEAHKLSRYSLGAPHPPTIH